MVWGISHAVVCTYSCQRRLGPSKADVSLGDITGLFAKFSDLSRKPVFSEHFVRSNLNPNPKFFIGHKASLNQSIANWQHCSKLFNQYTVQFKHQTIRGIVSFNITRDLNIYTESQMKTIGKRRTHWIEKLIVPFKHISKSIVIE